MSFYHNQLFPVDFYKVNSKKIINKLLQCYYMNVESLQIISKFMNDYEYEKAMELCDELLKKDNDNSHLWALKGCCLNHFEKYVEAMECYNKSLKCG